MTTAAVGIGSSIWHWRDTIKKWRVNYLDGYNAIGDAAFGISTDASRERNRMRGQAVIDSAVRFKDGDGPLRLRC